MVALAKFLDPHQPRCFIIAEVAQTHDGSLGQAYAFVDAVAQTGADAIKFQTHIADAESTPDEPFRVRFSRQDETRYDYWERVSFTKAQWLALADYTRQKGLCFLSSPFSLEAVDWLEEAHVPAWKVGSGEVNNAVFIERLAQTGKPVLLSSGMSSWTELDEAVHFLKQRQVPLVVFQATSMYPTPAEFVGLNLIPQLKERYGCTVGLSDHSAMIYAGLGAYMLGARFLEVHVTLSPWMFGPDVPASLTIEQLTELVRGVRFLELCIQSPVDKDAMANQLSDLQGMFNKSVVPCHDIPVQHILTAQDLALKKPGQGIPANRFQELIGCRTRRALRKNEFFTWQDIEPAAKQATERAELEMRII